MTRLAVIVKGRWGKNIIQTASALPDVEVVAFCGRERDWHDVFTKKPDGVIVAAHPSLNREVVQYANVLGVPVMIEKPAALYLSDIYKMEQCKVPILVDYIHLFNPQYQHMKASISGTISLIASIGYNDGPIRDYSSLYDYGVHDLALCMDLVPKEFLILDQKAKNSANGGRMFNLHLQAGKTQVVIKCGNGGTEKVRKLAVFCENGNKLLFDDQPSKVPLQNAIGHFVDVIRGKELLVPFELTVRIHKLLHQLEIRYEQSK